MSQENLLPPILNDVTQPRVVVIGGGFGGLELVKKLSKQKVQVVMIDRNNFHTFQPLLYQVATGGLEPASIAYPFRKLFNKYSKVIFRMAEVQKIVTESNEVVTNIGRVKYDFLVIATGSKTNFFGLKSVEENSARMKSVSEALDIRSMILQNFEESLQMYDEAERDSHMNVVIVGGGPTGVETAGALGELKKYVFPKDYRELDLRRMQIHIIEASGKLLGMMSPGASEMALKYVQELNVNVWLNTVVENFDGKEVKFKDGKSIHTKTVIWSAGVTGGLIEGLPPAAIAPGNRIKVNAYNQAEGYTNIFSIGDVAAMITDKTPKGHPMLAPVAIQQAQLLAKNIKNILAKKTLKPFVYNDKGSMATIGRNRAVVDLPRWKFQGAFAWFVWMFVHLMSLVGFRNKVVAFVDWFWNYISYDRALRLIIRPFKRKTE